MAQCDGFYIASGLVCLFCFFVIFIIYIIQFSIVCRSQLSGQDIFPCPKFLSDANCINHIEYANNSKFSIFSSLIPLSPTHHALAPCQLETCTSPHLLFSLSRLQNSKVIFCGSRRSKKYHAPCYLLLVMQLLGQDNIYFEYHIVTRIINNRFSSQVFSENQFQPY